jgi:transcriptional regulator with XRE-family HTH domain
MPKSVFTDAYQIVRERLRQARLDAGLSQTELAKRVGKNQQFISYIELGVRRVDLVEFYAIMRALDLDPTAAAVRLLGEFPEDVAI